MAAKAKFVSLLSTPLVVRMRSTGLNEMSCFSCLGYKLGFVKLGRIREYYRVTAMETFTGRFGTGS